MLVAACVAALSSSSHDYLKDGLLASVEADEKRCPDLDMKVLTSIEDVHTPAKKALSKLGSECAPRDGETCEVVSLFSGSRYQIYRYKRYSDVRLVFAPEQQLAFFGHERDSITYLRYGLDVAFARL
jgi:hypothetical protein